MITGTKKATFTTKVDYIQFFSNFNNKILREEALDRLVYFLSYGKHSTFKPTYNRKTMSIDRYLIELDGDNINLYLYYYDSDNYECINKIKEGDYIVRFPNTIETYSKDDFDSLFTTERQYLGNC